LLKVAALHVRRASYILRTARGPPLAHRARSPAPNSRTRRLWGPAQPPNIWSHSLTHHQHVWPNIQAEGLTLQRSTNMCGYKHVAKDKSKPRPFQVKIWHNGKQARLVRSPRAPHCAVLFPTVAIQGAP